LNFTIALIAGLVLLLPGITALVSWNLQGAAHGAKRPELQLTSVTALFLALSVAVILHILGYAVVSLIWASAAEIGFRSPALILGDLITNPYDMALGLALGDAKPSAGTIEAFLIIILVESLLAWRILASEGLDVMGEATDIRAQGWVFQHVVRPSKHGYRPIAYILTLPAQGEYGLGYEGIIADIRQGDNGELKSISLAEPESFVYRIVPARTERPRLKPRLAIMDREWVGGIVALDASVIRNIVVHNIPRVLIEQVEAEPAPATAEGGGQSDG